MELRLRGLGRLAKSHTQSNEQRQDWPLDLIAKAIICTVFIHKAEVTEIAPLSRVWATGFWLKEGC